jgi:hypothetical protein
VVVEAVLGGFELLLEGGGSAFQVGGAGPGGLRIGLVPGLHQLADGAAQLVQFGQSGVEVHLGAAAQFIELVRPVQEGLGVDVALGEALFGLFTVLSDERQFQHVRGNGAWPGAGRREVKGASWGGEE